MSYRILTDSCCDFTKERYEELGLHALPLAVTFRGETYPDRNDGSLKTFYDGLRAGEPATTSAVNPQQWEDAMVSVLEGGEDVLALTFSSGLSTTYQSAVIAAGELKERYPDRKILVVDSLCASLGQGLLAFHAAKKREAGMPLEDLARWLEENRLHLCHWFTVNDLMYLKRGGRISAATAVMGTMLSVKPILHVDDEGRLISVGKVRGRKASIEALVQKALELGLPGENETMFICHGDCIDDARYLEKLVREKCGVKNVFIGYTGAVIGSHSGPGTLALFFLGTHR